MNWRYVGASVIGSGHLAQALPCQDANLIQPVGDDALLLVASDGAGSAEHSAEGSQITCATLAEEILRHVTEGGTVDQLTPTVVDQWVNVVMDRLHTQATARGVAVRELACTLVMALVSPRISHFAQVGDGAIVVGRDGTYTAATWPDSGEYANTTYFVTDDLALQRLQVRLNEPPVDDVAVFTDGLQMLLLQFAERAAYAPFFDRMFRPLRAEPPGEVTRLREPLEDYLGSPEICRRTDDDKSLLLATRAAAPALPVQA